MSTWQPDHAHQLLAAYAVLRGAGGDREPAEVLYHHWYAVRSPHAVASNRWEPPAVSAARAAHHGAGDWADVDSEVLATGIAGVVVVGTPRGRRALCRGEYVTTSGRPGFPPRVGDKVRSQHRLGGVVQDGWWRTWGATWDPQHPGPLDRVYLRPVGGAVAPIVNAVTSALAQTGAWLLKVAPTADGLCRPDAVVTYLAGPARVRDRAAVVAAANGMTAGEPPALTQALGEGIGWAQDPGTGESFGEVRCAAIAAAYARLDGGHASDAEWLETVADEFSCRGIDPDSPHRSALAMEVLL